MAKIGNIKAVKAVKNLCLKLERSKAAAKTQKLIGKIPLLKRYNTLSLRKRRIGATSLFIIILLLAGFLIHSTFFAATKATAYTEYTVSKNDITVSISGTGTAEPIKQYNVVSKVTGDVLSDTFSEGDLVSKGAVLYTIDSSEMEKTLQKSDISLEKSQMNYSDAVDAYSGATVTAPISGQISEVLVAKGDNVSSGSHVAKIANSSSLTATVSFVTGDIGNLYVGQSASVTLENSFETLTGKITKIYNSKRILDGSVSVTDVDVTVSNPGALTEGTSVTVSAGGVSSYESGDLEYGTEQYITASTSGTVSKIVAPEGTYVKSGAAVLKLSGNSESDSLKSSQLDLKDAQLSYQSTQDQLDDYTIKSPIAGSVISKTVKAGDTIDNASGNTVLAVVADMTQMTFDISVDELDVASLKEGQTVNITADALENKTFTGYVSNVGLLGTTANGVTTYPVTIMIDNPDGLWPGMNLTADIVTDSATDVLAIPVGAVSRGNLVLVKGTAPAASSSASASDTNTSSAKSDRPSTSGAAAGARMTGSAMTASGSAATSGSAMKSFSQSGKTRTVDQSTAPDGYYYAQVTLGINDDTYIEIKSGLSAGDIILVPAVTSTAAATTKSNAALGGGGGSMGGGGMSGPPAGM